jgi:hypothetical protein
MGTWIKLFSDGPSEVGCDSEIEKGNASWSRGRLDSISGVQITEGTIDGELRIPNTEWHQFDRYESSLGGIGVSPIKRVARIIQAKIQEHHLGMFLCYNIDDSKFLWASVESCLPKSEGIQRAIKITDTYLDHWLSLCICANRKYELYIGERGKFNGNKQVFR